MSRTGAPPLPPRPRHGSHDAATSASRRTSHDAVAALSRHDDTATGSSRHGAAATATVSSRRAGHGTAVAAVRHGDRDTGTASAGTLSSQVSVAFAAPQAKPGVRAASGAPAVAAPLVDRHHRSEARLLAAAIASAIICCFVLVAYLTAYAQITRLGMLQSSNRVALRAAQLHNQTLRAQCAALERPGRIQAKAEDMGMVLETKRVCYIEPSGPAQALPPGAPPNAKQIALASGE